MNTEAYRKARFRAQPPEGGWPEAFGVVTACNPYGKTIPHEKNAERTAGLKRQLVEEGLECFPVIGHALDTPHQEEGFGVVCGKEEILRLGRIGSRRLYFGWRLDGYGWYPVRRTVSRYDLRSLTEMLSKPSCPYCGAGMDSGFAALEYRAMGLFFAGVSSLTLFFREKGRKRVPILNQSREAYALHCKACGALVLARNLREVSPEDW